MRPRSFRAAIPLIAALLLSLFNLGAVGAATPRSMAATGDSITRAFNTCFFPFTDCVSRSWSTGSNSTTNSHARRLGITNNAFNDAVSGAVMSDLQSQMGSVVSHGQAIDYVTVLMGANDVCTSTVGGMTEPALFETQLRAGLDALAASANGRNAVVYVVSIPNVYRLWQILHTNSSAVSTWGRYGICQGLLANATSLDATDEARRRDVRARNLALSTVLDDVCAEYAALDTLDCRRDGYAGFRYDFVPNDVSTRDYFHPSASGQATVAARTWEVGPYGTLPTSSAPVAHFTMSCSDLSCSFDAGHSVDPDGTALTYAWSFGDGNSAIGSTASHTFAAGGTYTVQLTANDGSQTDVDAGTFTVSGGGSTNSPPTASFTNSCTNLACSFDGSGSSDSDGSVAGYAWNFGDGATATGVTAEHKFAVGGTYTVTLTVTDDGTATDTEAQSVTVSSGTSITLSVSAYKVKGTQHADLSWSGASSTDIDVYRDGVKIETTANDGFHTDNIGRKGGGSYTFEVCEAGTTTCSNEASVSY